MSFFEVTSLGEPSFGKRSIGREFEIMVEPNRVPMMGRIALELYGRRPALVVSYGRFDPLENVSIKYGDGAEDAGSFLAQISNTETSKKMIEDGIFNAK